MPKSFSHTWGWNMTSEWITKGFLARVLDIFMGFCFCIKYTNHKFFKQYQWIHKINEFDWVYTMGLHIISTLKKLLNVLLKKYLFIFFSNIMSCESQHLITEWLQLFQLALLKHLSCHLIEQCKPEILTTLINPILCHFDWFDQIRMGMVLDILLLLIVKTEQSQHQPEAILHWKTEACDLQMHQSIL